MTASALDREYLSPARVARKLGKHPATVARWILDGVGGAKLRAVRIGSRWATTAEWVDEFLTACTGDPPPATPAHSAAPAQRASAALAARGF